jgi:hypothetical protein
MLIRAQMQAGADQIANNDVPGARQPLFRVNYIDCSPR